MTWDLEVQWERREREETLVQQDQWGQRDNLDSMVTQERRERRETEVTEEKLEDQANQVSS